MAHPPTLVGGATPGTASEQRQEADRAARPTRAAACASQTPSGPPAERDFERTTPVGSQRDRLRLQAQHRTTGLGRRSSISASMRRNRWRDTATSAIWNTV